jgi:ubiquinone/menaquinone biosynthesis C-methylase UbiE
MLPKPACYGEKYASTFQERGVAAAYKYRPPYPADVTTILTGLIADTPAHVLDAGCGTGALARNLADLVDRVDAVDISEAMIAAGRQLPNGDHPQLCWIVGRAEDAPLQSPYALITTGDSLHWMEWQVVMPRFARLLTEHGLLAILENGQLPLVWDAELLPIIQKYSIYGREYQPVNLVDELERRGLFSKHGATRTAPARFTQTIEQYIESFHGRASLARERMAPDAAAAFDAEVHALVSTYAEDAVELQVVAEIAWGKPLNEAASDK